MKNIKIQCSVNINSILDSLYELEDIEKANFAIKLGYGGDITYELVLLKKIIKLLAMVYKNAQDDTQINELNKHLKQALPILNDILNE